jgi:hypothetical protein
MAKLETKDYRNYSIKVINNKETVAAYEGKIYIYFGDKATDGCIHFVDEAGKHHRIYGEGTVIIDEI